MQTTKDPEKLRTASSLKVEDILRNIYYYRIHDYVEQIALLNTLPAFLKEHPEVRSPVPNFVETLLIRCNSGAACRH